MTTIFFKGEVHKQRFVEGMQSIGGKVYRGKYDPEYACAIYVLTADLATWRAAQSYVSRHGIDIPTMLEEVDFSGAYSQLLLWASNLFNSWSHVDPVEMMRLDENNFRIALSALIIRRYGLQVSDFREVREQKKANPQEKGESV